MIIVAILTPVIAIAFIWTVVLVVDRRRCLREVAEHNRRGGIPTMCRWM